MNAGIFANGLLESAASTNDKAIPHLRLSTVMSSMAGRFPLLWVCNEYSASVMAVIRRAFVRERQSVTGRTRMIRRFSRQYGHVLAHEDQSPGDRVGVTRTWEPLKLSNHAPQEPFDSGRFPANEPSSVPRIVKHSSLSPLCSNWEPLPRNFSLSKLLNQTKSRRNVTGA